MSVKEKPLIKAVERLGPLPGFLFSHPLFTGIFAIMMCAVFGAAFTIFHAAGYGGAEALVLFEAARFGAMFGVGFGALVIGFIAMNTQIDLADEPEEKRVRMQFVYGGILGLVSLVAFDFIALEWLRAYFAQAGPLMCTSHSAGCN